MPHFAPVGDHALSVGFDDVISPEVNALVRSLDRAIAVSNLPGIVETVPGFRSLLIVYEPETIDFATLTNELDQLIGQRREARGAVGRSWSVPVVYGSPTDDDLREVAAATGLTPDEIVAVHSGAEFQVYFVGFVPGLPVLGGLPPALHIPRRPEPRLGIQTGSVMIGGMQGLIVPMTMPSGWYSLGQTPLRPYQPGAADPFLFRAGDRIRFRPIAAEAFASLASLPGERFLDVA